MCIQLLRDLNADLILFHYAEEDEDEKKKNDDKYKEINV